MQLRFTPSDCVVLVIDIQERLAPAIAPEDRERLLRGARLLVEAAKLFEVPVVTSEQYPRGLGPTIPELAELLPAAPIAKTEFSALGNSGVAAALEASGRKLAIVIGMEAHVCVLQSVLALLEGGYAVHVCHDGVGSRSVDDKRAALDLMRGAGAAVTSVESVAFQWCRDAADPRFKALSKLVK